jgi:hypothetical protein
MREAKKVSNPKPRPTPRPKAKVKKGSDPKNAKLKRGTDTSTKYRKNSDGKTA